MTVLDMAIPRRVTRAAPFLALAAVALLVSACAGSGNRVMAKLAQTQPACERGHGGGGRLLAPQYQCDEGGYGAHFAKSRNIF